MSTRPADDTVCSRLRRAPERRRRDARRRRSPRQYYRWVSPEDIAERRDLDLYGAALAHFDLARRRAPGYTKVRIYNPEFEVHGWESPHTAVEIVTDDMPFLIDSIGMELNRRGFGVHLIIHPVIQVRRDDEGNLLEVLPHGAEADGALAESVIHAEVARARPTRPSWSSSRGPPRARDRRGARGGDGLAGDARPGARRGRRARDRPAAARRRRDRRDARVPRLARGPQLHLPRLPRLRADRRRRPSSSLESVPDSGLGILRHAEGEERAASTTCRRRSARARSSPTCST